MFDNCQYKVILRASDVDTQKYLAELIGTQMLERKSVTTHWNQNNVITGYSENIGQQRDFIVQPHEFSALTGVLLKTLTHYHHLEKIRPESESGKAVVGIPASEPVVKENAMNNWGAKMSDLKERVSQAKERIHQSESDPKKREETHLCGYDERVVEREKQELRFNIVGKIVCDIIPELNKIEARSDEKIKERFKTEIMSRFQ